MQGLWPIFDQIIASRSRTSLFDPLNKLPNPTDFEEYLGNSVGELRNLVRGGVTNRRTDLLVHVLLHNLIDDAPTNSHVKQVKQHSR